MLQNDDVVSGWLSGQDSIEGHDNPAGPLFIEGSVATEAAMTQVDAAAYIFTTLGGTTASCRPTSCYCC